MSEHSLPSGRSVDRHVELRAAAEALVTWVHAQRGTSRAGLVAASAAANLQPALVGAEYVAGAEAKRPPRPAAPPWLRPWIAGRARAFGSLLVRLWRSVVGRTLERGPGLLRRFRRVGATVVLAAIVLVGGARAWQYARGGWPDVRTLAQTYWSQLLNALKSGTEVPTPEADPTGAAGTAPGGSAASAGSLDVQSDPAGARVLIDGTFRGVTPLTVASLRAGSHLVVLESDKGSISKTVAVAAGRTALMSESIFGGWIHVSAPFEVLVSEGGRGMRPDARNEVLLTPGTHALLFENRDLGYRETRQVEIAPGATTAVSIAPPPSKLTVTATLAADVIIDGERAGSAPVVDYDVPLGTREIVVRSESGAERRFTRTMTVKPARIDVDFSKP